MGVEIENHSLEPEIKVNKFTRRRFLKIGLLTVAGLSFGDLTGSVVTSPVYPVRVDSKETVRCTELKDEAKKTYADNPNRAQTIFESAEARDTCFKAEIVQPVNLEARKQQAIQDWLNKPFFSLRPPYEVMGVILSTGIPVFFMHMRDLANSISNTVKAEKPTSSSK